MPFFPSAPTKSPPTNPSQETDVSTLIILNNHGQSPIKFYIFSGHANDICQNNLTVSVITINVIKR